MNSTVDGAFRSASAAIEHLVRTIVREELRQHRAFELRLAQRRAEGGERAESLRRAEAQRVRLENDGKRREERRAKRAKQRKQ